VATAASAAAALRQAWLDDDLSTSLEKEILGNYGALLSRDDHKARMYAMIMAQETNAAVRAAGMVSRQHVQAAKAAQALIRRKNNGPALYKKLPAEFRNHPPMLYAYARYFRRKGDYATAFNLLKRGPASHAAQIRPDQWFVEKRLAARHLAAPKYRKHWPAIYQMMASHGFKSGKHYIEAEFLAGWFALRKLSKPGAAAVHFKRITEAATTRTDGSRGWYWLGRARAAKGEGSRAEQAYRQAAASPTLFYGQLALDKLGQGKRPLNISTGSASSAGLAKAKQVEVFRAAHLLSQAGGSRQVGLFLFPIARAIKSPVEAASAIDAIHSQEGYFAAVRLAKAFGAVGVDVDNWAYPVNALPELAQHRPARGKIGNPRAVAPGERIQCRCRQPRRRQGADADHAGNRQGHCAALQDPRLPHQPPDAETLTQRGDGRSLSRRPDRPVRRVIHPGICRIQCRARQREEVDRHLWRSALTRRRCNRLDRIGSDYRNAQVHPESDAERPRVPHTA
jgi:soluble lytic murein transglycosylase